MHGVCVVCTVSSSARTDAVLSSRLYITRSPEINGVDAIRLVEYIRSLQSDGAIMTLGALLHLHRRYELRRCGQTVVSERRTPCVKRH